MDFFLAKLTDSKTSIIFYSPVVMFRMYKKLSLCLFARAQLLV